MPEWLKITAIVLGAGFGILLVRGLLLMGYGIIYRRRHPYKGLAHTWERRWMGAGVVVFRLLDLVDEGKISVEAAEARIDRIEHYEKTRIGEPRADEKLGYESFDFARKVLNFLRRKHLLRDLRSPSTLIH